MREALAASSKIVALLPPSQTAVSREIRRERSSFRSGKRANGPAAGLLPDTGAPAAPLHAVHALHLYGALGIAAFGWSLGRWAGFSSTRLLPLWLAGALVVYNLDRLKRDPADAINIPHRAAQHERLRAWSVVLAALGAIVLLLWPIWLGSPALLLLTALAIPLSLSYSFPVFGRRMKDVPVLKTLFAPLVVLMAVLGPPVLLQDLSMGRPLLLAAGWSWALLMFNMVLCDLRDIEGDRAAGTKSLPVLLGGEGTQVLLWALIAGGAACAAIHGWPILASLTVAALAPLALAASRRRGEAFYEWLAEGTLFLPALVELGKNLVHHLAA